MNLAASVLTDLNLLSNSISERFARPAYSRYHWLWPPPVSEHCCRPQPAGILVPNLSLTSISELPLLLPTTYHVRDSETTQTAYRNYIVHQLGIQGACLSIWHRFWPPPVREHCCRPQPTGRCVTYLRGERERIYSHVWEDLVTSKFAQGLFVFCNSCIWRGYVLTQSSGLSRPPPLSEYHC
jgi:hypothetical protein